MATIKQEPGYIRYIKTVKRPVGEHEHLFDGAARCMVCHKHMDDLPEVWE